MAAALARSSIANTLRLLGRWMRMITIPNQSSVAKAFQEFDEAGRMKPSAYYDRVVDVMEELFKMTLLLRENQADHRLGRLTIKPVDGNFADLPGAIQQRKLWAAVRTGIASSPSSS